jgi:hypothetical protein
MPPGVCLTPNLRNVYVGVRSDSGVRTPDAHLVPTYTLRVDGWKGSRVSPPPRLRPRSAAARVPNRVWQGIPRLSRRRPTEPIALQQSVRHMAVRTG